MITLYSATKLKEMSINKLGFGRVTIASEEKDLFGTIKKFIECTQILKLNI
jgi:hypothetical protein